MKYIRICINIIAKKSPKDKTTLYYSQICSFFATICIRTIGEERNMTQVSIGDIVQTRYNSGTYIGEVLEDKQNFLLVKVLAVVTHPTQGDLHNRGQVEGVAFHERKALAFEEKFNARKRMTTLFEGEVPEYAVSLKQAVEEIKAQLQKEQTPFNELSLSRIADLEKHYYQKIYS